MKIYRYLSEKTHKKFIFVVHVIQNENWQGVRTYITNKGKYPKKKIYVYITAKYYCKVIFIVHFLQNECIHPQT